MTVGLSQNETYCLCKDYRLGLQWLTKQRWVICSESSRNGQSLSVGLITAV